MESFQETVLPMEKVGMEYLQAVVFTISFSNQLL